MDSINGITKPPTWQIINIIIIKERGLDMGNRYIHFITILVTNMLNMGLRIQLYQGIIIMAKRQVQVYFNNGISLGQYPQFMTRFRVSQIVTRRTGTPILHATRYMRQHV